MRVNFARTVFCESWVLLFALAVPLATQAASDGEISNHIISINRLYENLEYERALNHIQLARQVPRGTNAEVTLSLYEGIILYELGKQEPGTSAFKFALRVRLDAKLPVRVAPSIERLFESVREQVKIEVVTLRALRKTESPPTSTPSEPPPVGVTPKGSPAPPVKREDRVLLPSPTQGAPKPDDGVTQGQTSTSRCQAAVSTECERLLKRLLHLQDTFLLTDSFFKLGPLEELDQIAKQFQVAQTSEMLRKAANDLDSWRHQHLGAVK